MKYDFDLVVIGSGPGGYVAAIRDAQGLKPGQGQLSYNKKGQPIITGLKASESEKSIKHLNKRYLPENVPNLFSPTFCDEDTNKWDQNGVPEQNKNLPETCISNNNSITKILNQPYDAPGVLYSDKTSEYSWMFNIFSNPGTVTRNLV